MINESVFDQFLKDRLSCLKGNYDRSTVQDLKPALDQAQTLGYFELGQSEESFRLLCLLLRKSAYFDGGFAMIVFIQAVVQKLFALAGTHQEGLFAFQPFQNLSSELSLHVKDGKHLITGDAKMVALGAEASLVLLSVDSSLFLVRLSAAKTTKSVPVVGMRTLPISDLRFEDAEAELIGASGGAVRYFSEMARPLRIAAAAMMFGILDGAYRDAYAYAHERIQGGRKIIEWSEHKMSLSRILSRLRVCESLLAYGLDQAEKLTDAQSLSTFIHFQESLDAMTSSSMQAMGGAGYMKDYPLERFYRDAHQLRCLFGTTPFHKLDLFSREGTNV